MKLPEPNGGGDFTPTPAGQHNSVLTRFIDLGTQPGSAMYPKPKRKILMGWEIPGERVKWEKDGQEQEGPMLHFERMTFSTHENAIFRQRLESWRGKPFTVEDWGNFDTKNLLNVGAFIQISHDHKDGKTYANMQTIILPPGGKDSWAKPEGDVIYFSLEDFDQQTFDRLSEGLQATIKGSPEYLSLFGQAPEGHVHDRNSTMSENPGAGMDALGEEIPF